MAEKNGIGNQDRYLDESIQLFFSIRQLIAQSSPPFPSVA